MSGLTNQQLEFFHTEGYLHVPEALRPEDLDPLQAELEEIVDRAARRLVAAGKIDRDFSELPFERRLIPLGKADASAADDSRASWANLVIAATTSGSPASYRSRRR